jgi:ParB-like chromosome segregation protein Spo0J
MNRIKISKQIDADEQKGNATIVELAGRKIIIDGHERLMALWLLGLDEAPVWIVKE